MPRRADITWSTCIALFWAVSFSANTGEQRQFYRILVYFKRNRHHVKHMHHFGLSKLTSTTGHLTSKSPTTNSSWHSRENKNFESECTKISVEHTLSQIRNLQFSDFLSESRYCTRTSFDGPTPPIGGEKSLHSISFSHGARSPAQDRPESQQVNPFDTSKIIKMATKNQNDDNQNDDRWSKWRQIMKRTTKNQNYSIGHWLAGVWYVWCPDYEASTHATRSQQNPARVAAAAHYSSRAWLKRHTIVVIHGWNDPTSTFSRRSH